MGVIRRGEILSMAMEEYMVAWGYSERTARDVATIVRQLMRKTRKYEEMKIKDVESLIAKKDISAKTKSNYRQAVRHWQKFYTWWEQEGKALFKNWLRRQGYSEHTIKEYYYALDRPSGKIELNRTNEKRINSALSAFSRFVNELFT